MLLGEGSYDDQWHTETVFVRINQRRRHVVIPSTPIIPRDDDDRIVPILALADGIDHRRNPGWPQPCIGPGMVRLLPGRYHPANIGQLTVGNVGQYLRRLQNDIVAPIRAKTQMVDGIRPSPDRTRRWRVIPPSHSCIVEQIRQRWMLEARIHLLRLTSAGTN